jgi:hypothetical protein
VVAAVPIKAAQLVQVVRVVVAMLELVEQIMPEATERVILVAVAVAVRFNLLLAMVVLEAPAS